MSTVDGTRINLTNNRWEKLAAAKLGDAKMQDGKAKVEFKRPALTATTNFASNLINGTAKLSLKSQSDVPLKEALKPSGTMNLRPRVVKKKLNDENYVPKESEVSKPVSKIPRLSVSSRSASQALLKVNTNATAVAVVAPLKPVTETEVKAKPKVAELEPVAAPWIAGPRPEFVEDIDEGDAGNIYLTPDYVEDIYNHLRYLETKQQIKPDFLAQQKQMTPKMRSILVDWIIGLHYQFRLAPETLYMTIAIADRFFQKEPVVRDRIQLVGVTALFIAAKVEEIYPVDVKDLLKMCEGIYSKKDVFKMEMAILKALRFDLGRPIPLHFLRRLSKAAHVDSRIHTMAKFLIELATLEYECASWDPSLMAAVAIYVTLRMSGICDWNMTMEYYSRCSEQKLLPYASKLCQIILKSSKSKQQAVRQKYSTSKFMKVSVAPELDSQIVKDLAGVNPTKFV